MRDRNAYASLREGLVGAWIPSVSGSGLLLPDLSGNGNNGTLTNMGPEDWVSGQYGRALDSDGVNDYVNLGTASELGLSSVLSYSFWFNARTLAGHVLTCWDLVGGVNQRTIIHTFSSSKLRQYWSASGDLDNLLIETKILTTSTWYHACSVYRSGVRELWLNGNLEATISQATISTAATTSRLGLFAVLGRSIDTPTLFLNGNADDIRIYNRALSESEIKLLASRPGIGLRPQRRTMYYAPPTGARRRRILTSMP